MPVQAIEADAEIQRWVAAPVLRRLFYRRQQQIDSPPQGPRELRFPGGGGADASIDISYEEVKGGLYYDLKILVYNDLGLLASLSARSAAIDYQRHSGLMVLSQCHEPRLVY